MAPKMKRAEKNATVASLECAKGRYSRLRKLWKQVTIAEFDDKMTAAMLIFESIKGRHPDIGRAVKIIKPAVRALDTAQDSIASLLNAKDIIGGRRFRATARLSATPRKVFDDIVGKATIAEVQDKLAFAMHIFESVRVVKTIRTTVSALDTAKDSIAMLLRARESIKDLGFLRLFGAESFKGAHSGAHACA